MEEKQNKDIGSFVKDLYNVKIKPEDFGDESVKQLKEAGFEIKMEIKPICTYNVWFKIPDEIKESEKLDYVKGKLRHLNYVVDVEKSVEMKALYNDNDGSNPV
jgi:hypothetical protein